MSDLHISEMFTSIQGEGILSGRPSIFIRFSGCNNHCIWCDTPPKPPDPSITMESIEDMLVGFPYHDVVITGGEPLLHQKEVREVIYRSRKLDWSRGITIETNGTIEPDESLDPNLWSVSPKLSSSGEKYSSSIIEKFKDKFGVQFKFVVDVENPDDLTDLENICKIIEDVRIIVVQPVSLACYTNEFYIYKYKNLIETILDMKLPNNIRITPQLHKLVWGFNTDKV